METFKLLAYITGGICVAYSLFIYLFPNRKTSLLLKGGAEILSVINLIMIYFATENELLFAGIATTSLSFIREIIYTKKNDV